jgi:hypothetical protein
MKSDFDHWLDYHGRAYPGFTKWTADNADQIDHLRRLLARYTRQQLEAATDTLYEQDTQPNGYSHHGRAIRRLIAESSAGSSERPRELGPTVHDGQLVARCRRCMDFGLVEVLSPVCLKRLSTNDDTHGLTTCMLACDCGLGEKMSRIHRVPRWEDGRMLIRYEDILDEFVTTHETFWEVARRLFLHRASQRRVHPDFQAYA